MKKLLLFFILFVVLTGSVAYLWFHRVTNTIFVQSTKKVTVDQPKNIAEYFAKKIPFNVLVVGYGGGNHDGAYLTDTMILVHVDPKNQKVFLVTIPRDIWIKIPTNGTNGSYAKLNAAYAYGIDDRQFPNKSPEFMGPDGGGRLAEYAVGQVTGQTIPYFIGLDFSGFTHTIDTLGGVDINVNPAFTDPQYPIDGKEADLCGNQPDAIPTLDAAAATGAAELVYPCRYETLHFDAGLQHMDGATALKYVRSRHSLEDGTDFGRSKRQEKLILAVKQKVMSIGFVTRVIPFMDSLGGDFKTDVTLDDVKTLVQKVNELNGYSIQTLALTDQNYLVDSVVDGGGDVLLSKDGTDNWQTVHTWLGNTFAGLPVPVIPVVKVLNGTKTPGLAQYATDRLTDLHYKTLPPGSSPDHAVTQTSVSVYDGTLQPNDLAALKKEFGVLTVVNESTATPSAYNVLVVLGTDYKPTPSATPSTAP